MKAITSACYSPLRGWDLRSAALHYGPKCGRYVNYQLCGFMVAIAE